MPARAADDYLPIEGTTSPNGQYALAWGIRDQPNLGAFLGRSPRRGQFASAVENYVIDTRTGRKLGWTTSQHWTHSAIQRPKWLELEAKWTPDSEILLLLHSRRGNRDLAEAYRVHNGQLQPPANISAYVEAPLRRLLMKSYSTKFRPVEFRVVFAFRNLRAVGNSRYAMDIDIRERTRESANGFRAAATTEFEVHPHGSGVSVRIRGVKKRSLPAKS